MRRIIGWSIPLVLIMIGLLWPLVFKGGHEELPADDPVVFSNLKADFSVSADGSMDAIETITADFPGGRHGLFQYWDTANQNHPFVRQVPDIQSVEIDGVAAPYQMLWEDGTRFRIAKIGNPDEYLSYGRMKQVDISVTLPSDVTAARCSVGFGVGSAGGDLTITGNKVSLSTGYLGSGTQVTVRAGVDMATPPREQLLWPYTWDRVLGSSLSDMVWIVHAVQMFAAHQKDVLDHVTDARAALTSATSGKSVAERSAAEKEFDSVLALGQSCAQLNSSNNFLNLQDNLADTENKLAFARQYYNDAVATLNRLITALPWTFVAPLSGVSECEFCRSPR